MSADPESVRSLTTPPVIAGLILAAGESSRMGADKPLLMYHGKTFLENIIAALRDARIPRVVVVLGHNADLIQQSIDLASVEVVVNPDYHRGQTSSLQAGLRILEWNEQDGAIICLVDHPAISADTVLGLIECFKCTGKSVIIPQLRGKHGHPILVGGEVLSGLRALGPNQGADSVIHQYRDRSEFVEVRDPGILIDVDDPESYLELTARK